VLSAVAGPATPELEVARGVLDQAALKGLRTFLDIVAMSDGVPSALREFMVDHRKFVAGEIARHRSAA